MSRTITPEQLAAHAAWMNNPEEGTRLELSDADLRGANLTDADLRGANLAGANLAGANLRGADLAGAYLAGANLRSANLRSANLRSADLAGANLTDAYLRSANLAGAALPAFQLPAGELIVWGKKAKVLVRLRIPHAARRTACLINRKCRAAFAWDEWHADGSDVVLVKNTYGDTVYRVGAQVWPHAYDDDPRIDCAPGIHFFLTRAEAEAWQ